MLTESACPQCGNLLKVRPEYLGSRLRCPNCNFVFRAMDVPVLELAEDPPPEPDVLTLQPVPPEQETEEEVPVLELAEEEPHFDVIVPERAPLPAPPPPTPPPPVKRVELILDGPPQPKPAFVEVFQPLRRGSYRHFRLYLQPEELRAIFIGIPLTEAELADAKARKRRDDRLKAIEVTTYADLLKDHRLNFRIELDDVTEASLKPCGFWYRFSHRPPIETRLLTLWHRNLGRMRFELRSPRDAERLREFLPGSLGKRLKVR